MRRIRYALLLTLAAAALAACGQKGPLYLPDPAEPSEEQREAEQKTKKSRS